MFFESERTVKTKTVNVKIFAKRAKICKKRVFEHGNVLNSGEIWLFFKLISCRSDILNNAKCFVGKQNKK